MQRYKKSHNLQLQIPSLLFAHPYFGCFLRPCIYIILMFTKPRSTYFVSFFCLNQFNCLKNTCESVKFIYSQRATKLCEISTLLLPYVVPVKSKVEISQNFVAFSEYMNIKNKVRNSLSNPVNE